MRRLILALVCCSLCLTLAAACSEGRGPYVTATPDQAAHKSTTPGAASQPALDAPTAAPTLPQATLTPAPAIEMPPMPPGFSEQPARLTLSSGAFDAGGEIPVEYTCHGDNVSPALDWRGVPAAARSLVLVMVDPDTTPAGFVHWLVYDIPPDSGGLEPFQTDRDTLDNGAVQGANSFGQFGQATTPGGAPISGIGYAGPCPPNAHRYQFLLYALDTTLDLEPGAQLSAVVAAMGDHVLASAELTARFAPPDDQ